MSGKLAFRLALVAAVLMFGVTVFMRMPAPDCYHSPIPLMTAFELVHEPRDLTPIFCEPGLGAQLDTANLWDTVGFIPGYTLFYVLTLYALGRRDRRIGWLGIGVALAAAVADWVENTALFQLSAAPAEPGGWIGVLMAATNVKWIGLGLVITLAGVMMARRWHFGWVGLVACAASLVATVLAPFARELVGPQLLNILVAGTGVMIVAAAFGAFAKDEARAG